MATQRILSQVARDMRIKQTEHLFQKSKEHLSSLAKRWQADSREYMALAERNLGSVIADDASIGNNNFKIVSQYFEHITSILNDALGSGVDAGYEFIKDLQETESQINRLPETRRMANGVEVKTGMDRAKVSLKETIRDAIRLIEKRIDVLRQAARKIKTPEGMVTEDDIVDEFTKSKVKRDNVFTDLSGRFNDRASSRSATYAFLRNRYVKRRDKKRERKDQREERVDQYAKKLAELRRKKIDRELQMLRREMLTAPVRPDKQKVIDTTPPDTAPPEPTITDPDEQLEDARQRILRFFDTPEREGGDGPEPPVPPRIITIPVVPRGKDGVSPPTVAPAPPVPVPSTDTITGVAGSDSVNMAEWAKEFIRKRNTTPIPTEAPDATTPTPVARRRRRRRVFGTDEPLRGRTGNLTRIENIIPLVVSIDETLRRTIGLEEAQTTALNKIANLEDEQMRLAETQTELSEDRIDDYAKPLANSTAPLKVGPVDGGSKDQESSGILGSMMSSVLSTGISLLGKGTLMTGLTGLIGKAIPVLFTGAAGLAIVSAIGLVVTSWLARNSAENVRSDAEKRELDKLKTGMLQEQQQLLDALHNAEEDDRRSQSTVDPIDNAFTGASIGAMLRKQQLMDDAKAKGLSDEQIAEVVDALNRGNYNAFKSRNTGAGAYFGLPTNLPTRVPQFTGGAEKAQAIKNIGQVFQTESQIPLPPELVAALLGNIAGESAFNPAALGDNGSAFGLAQWREGRRGNLLKFAQEFSSNPKLTEKDLSTDVMMQARFMLAEMGALGKQWDKYRDDNGTNKRSGANIIDTLPQTMELHDGLDQRRVIASYVESVMRNYERPSDKAIISSFKPRTVAALQAYELVYGKPATVDAVQVGDSQATGRELSRTQMAHAALSKEITAGNINLVRFDQPNTVINSSGSGGSSSHIAPPVHDRLPVLMPNKYNINTTF